MLELTRNAAQRAGVEPSLSVSIADACSLAGFGENQFHLVISLGVIAWLEMPERAISAAWRVLRPGGHLILSVGNRFCLHDLLDPRRNQLLAPARKKLAAVLRRMGWLATPAAVSNVRSPEDHHLAPWRVDRMLATANFCTEKSTTVGFGPFTLLRRELFSDSVSERLDRVLQGLADRNLLILRSVGAHYLVLAKKPC
jgi:ubiquinone/menaquinone biosynthesis C-methylase UbiE